MIVGAMMTTTLFTIGKTGVPSPRGVARKKKDDGSQTGGGQVPTKVGLKWCYYRPQTNLAGQLAISWLNRLLVPPRTDAKPAAAMPIAVSKIVWSF